MSKMLHVGFQRRLQLPTRLRLRLQLGAGAALALAAVLCSPPGALAESVALTRLFPLEATVEVDGGGLARLLLPPEVLRECRPDLSDLRLFDQRGRALALLIDSGRSRRVLEARERFEPDVLDLQREEMHSEDGPARFREVYRIQAPLRGPELGQPEFDSLSWELVFDDVPQRFVRDVSVHSTGRADTAGSEGPGRVLVERSSIFRLDGETERTRIALPNLASADAATLSVVIEGADGGFLEPRLRLEAVRRLGPMSMRRVPLEEIARTTYDGRTEIELARPPGIVPRVVRVETSTAAYNRKLEVWDEWSGRDPVRVGGGRVFRLAGTPDGERAELRLSGAGGERLRVEIDDGDSPPLAELRFVAVVNQPVIVFELPASTGDVAVATLRFGGGRAYRPRYDLSGLGTSRGRKLAGAEAAIALRLHDPTALPVARLGPIGANPEFDTSPALEFAMRPGATIDPRVFEHRRALTVKPSPEGLSRLQLSPEDTARGRLDLADLRVVDDAGRQWPYLLHRDARRGTVALEVESVKAPHKFSLLRLSLPVTPLRVDRITLDSSAPYFDRAYRLYAVDESGGERAVGSGRLKKDARRPRPTVIAVSPARSHGFVLEIEDGDDAPLSVRSASARVPLPVLYLAATAGEYTLLLGHPELAAPSYELERVRDVVLSVEHRPVSTGGLEENRDFSMTARLRSEDGARGWLHAGLVWGVLLAAVAILGALTLRVARQGTPESRAEGTAGDGGGSA